MKKVESCLEEGADGVQEILENRLEDVTGGAQGTVAEEEKKKLTRMNKSRKIYSAEMKAKLIQKVGRGVTKEMVAAKYGVSRSLICKWLKERTALFQQQQTKTRKCSQNREGQHVELYRLL